MIYNSPNFTLAMRNPTIAFAIIILRKSDFLGLRVACRNFFLVLFLFNVSVSSGDVWEMRLVEFGGVSSIPHSGDWSNTGEWIDPNPADSQMLPGVSDTVRIAPDAVSNRPNITLDIPVEVNSLEVFSELSSQAFVGIYDIDADFFTPEGGQDLVIRDKLTFRADETNVTRDSNGNQSTEYSNTDINFYDVFASADHILVNRSLENTNGRATFTVQDGAVLSRKSFVLNDAKLILDDTVIVAQDQGLTMDRLSEIEVVNGSTIVGDLVYNHKITLLPTVNTSFTSIDGRITPNTSATSTRTIELGERHSLLLKQTNEEATSTIDAQITGEGRLWISDEMNTVQLRGSNTFTGDINVIAGATLDVSRGNNFGALGKTLQLTNGNLRASGTFGIGIPVSINTASIDTNGNTVTASASWSGIGVLTKKGSGALILDNNNSGYTGSITVEEGALFSRNGDSFSNNTAVKVNLGADLVFQGAENFAGIEGDGLVNTISNTIRVGYNNSSYEFSGDLLGSGTFEKHGTGDQAFSSNNAGFTGSWKLEEGSLTFKTEDSLPDAITMQSDTQINWMPDSEPYTVTTDVIGAGHLAVIGNQTVVLDTDLPNFTGTIGVSQGTLQIDQALDSTSVDSIDLSGMGGMSTGANSLFLQTPVQLLGGTPRIDTHDNQIILASSLEGSGKLFKWGSGTLQVFHDSPDFEGDIHVREGVFTYSRNNMLDGSELIIDSGATVKGLQPGTSETPFDYVLKQLTGQGTLEIQENQIFSVGENNDGSYAFRGNLSGSGVFRKIGSGTLDLTGENENFAGPMIAADGLLRLVSTDAISSQAELTIEQAGTVEVVNEQRISALKGNGLLRLTSRLYVGLNDTSSKFDGVADGGGELVKTGSGVLTLTGSYEELTGSVRIDEGVLELSNMLPNWTPQLSIQGGELRVISDTTLSKTISSSGGSINTNGFDIDVTGSVFGNQPLTKRGEGALRFLATSNNLQSTLVVEEGSVEFVSNRSNSNINTLLELQAGTKAVLEAERRFAGLRGSGTVEFGTNTLGVRSSGSDEFAGTLDGTGDFVFRGTGQLNLSGNNSAYQGDVQVISGTLKVDGSLGSNLFTVDSNATLISGAGNTFTNQSTVSLTRATLILEGDENFGQIQGNGTLNVNDRVMRVGYTNTDGGFNGQILGSGAIEKKGSGILYITGDGSQFTGNWKIDDGSVQFLRNSFNGVNTMAAGVEIQAGATAHFNIGAENYTTTGGISGTGTFLKTGPKRLSLEGDSSSFDGVAQITRGELFVEGTLGGVSALFEDDSLLGGNGEIQASVVVQSGATVAPGNSPGQLTIESLTLEAGSILEIEIMGHDSEEFDSLLITQDVSLAGDLDLQLLNNYVPLPGTELVIMNILGERSGEFANYAEGAVVAEFSSSPLSEMNSIDPESAIQLYLTYQGGDGNDVVLYTLGAIPEPSTLLLLMTSLLAAGCRRC